MAFNLFPQTDFRQMDLNYVLEVSKQAAANLEEYAADKEQVVATQAAAEEALAAAQRDIQTATQAAASAGQDAQTATQAAGTATQAAADAEQDAQTASAAAATATAVQESIPADYTTLSNDVDNLKSDLSNAETELDFVQIITTNNAEVVETENGKYVNYSGVRGDASWNKLYSFVPSDGQIVWIRTRASLHAVPAYYFDDVPYPATAQTESGEYSGYIIGDGTTILRVNSEVVDGVETQAPEIKVSDVASLKALASAETKVSYIFGEVSAQQNVNRYINFSGVRGDATWNNMYYFIPEYGKRHVIHTRSAATVPAFYFDSAYPSESQSAEYTYTGFITGDGVTPCYVNCLKDLNGNEIIAVDIETVDYASAETEQEVKALKEVNNREFETVTTNTTANRFIFNNGVEGTLNGYTLHRFTTYPNEIYYIYSEVEAARAASGMPIVYLDEITYTNNTGKGGYVVKGNGEYCYVNSNSNSTEIKKYVFEPVKTTVPNVFRMFENIVCCGDSLTYSQVWNSDTSQRQALVPYPKVVEKITGTNTDIMAVAGYTCENWWTAFGAQITGSKKLYLIYLGTNDTNMTDTVATDCVGDDPTQYTNTPCGYYGRIIKTIQNSGSKCVLIKVALGSTGNARNSAITSLGTRFAVPVVNNPQYMLNDLYYHYGDDGVYYNTIHLNDIGYEAFAEYIVDAINALTLATKYALMP